MTVNPISRRVLLAGMGATVALPWLESLAVAAPVAKAAPKRFACMFIGDGISPPHWWSKGNGKDMELGSSLTALGLQGAPPRASITAWLVT